MNMKLKAVLFGAADGGRRLYGEIAQRYEILCYTDNDSQKWGKTLNEILIKEPSEALQEEWDDVIITSAPGCDSIYEQLRKEGVPEEKIITRYVDAPLKSRIEFLKSLGKMMEKKNLEGACAEAGVFQGDFAKHINEVYKNKKLYLFDTFCGFDSKDIVTEQQNNFSDSKEKDYSNASIEMVMNKMNYPENCVVKPGYFPETAKGIEEKFCFVNLDLDLYLPTLNGLWYFKDKMVSGGVILIHDYFAENFRGPQKAVDEFMEDNTNLRVNPIGDGISVMITGF